MLFERGISMLKTDILDELVDYFIRKAMENESDGAIDKEQKRKYTSRHQKNIRGDKENGLYASVGVRK